MNFYSEKNVYEAALDRFRYIFSEFKGRNIVISFSGGKDSTVILGLAHEVMGEFGISKIPVFFCDQEAEAPQTIEYIRKVMNYDWVEPYWIQSPFDEWNASAGKWFRVWGKGEKWVREKEPSGTYTNEKYKVTQHFKKVLDCMFKHHFGEDYISIGGVRIEESPTRRLALTQCKCYKDITWGKTISHDTEEGKGGLVLYPIWDWSYKDVWYYIFSKRLDYCKLYNYLFTKKPLNGCRVSSFIHTNAIQGLKDIKEIAPDFYVRMLNRVENVNTSVQTLDMFTTYVNELPKYFSSWHEYIHYLADNIIFEEKNRVTIKTRYDSERKKWLERVGDFEAGKKYMENALGRAFATTIATEDYPCSKVANQTMELSIYVNKHRDEIERANRTND